MDRLARLAYAAKPYRPLIQLALLGAALLAVSLSGGAPVCLPDTYPC